VLLIIFYRVWDPLTKQTLKWLITGIITAVILFISTRYFLIDESPCMLNLIDNYNEQTPGLLDPNSFMYYVSGLIAILSMILTFVYSLIIKRFSINNSHNPF